MALAYGHVGDGNVHFNVIPPRGLAPGTIDALFHGAEELIFDVVDRLGGSISAEHGIGRSNSRPSWTGSIRSRSTSPPG